MRYDPGRLTATVLGLVVKLSYVPLLVFRSLDPEHAVHATFYRPLLAYLSLPAPLSAPEKGQQTTC